MSLSNKIKIVTVVGTRPEIIRLSSIISRLNSSSYIDHYLIHTGQNYDHNLNEIFFDDLGLSKPHYYLDAAKETSSKTIGEILIKIDPILDDLKPDAMLVLGDTNSCLSVISAKKKKIPIFHLEAGNRCFDMRVPEETNRKIVDHISDINLTYSDIAREHLIQEGLKSDRVIKVGSPMYEVINKHELKIKNSNILKSLKLKEKQYILVSCHREENIDYDSNFNNLIECLNKLAELFKFDIIFSTHPRTRKIIEQKRPKLNNLVKLIEPLGFIDYNNLQINSFVVISDSGTISEESSILNFKALNIRDSHERPEAMEESSVILTGLNPDSIIQAIDSMRDQDTGSKRNILLVKDYSIPNVSMKVERIILSYINYVNRVVWQKES
tara:strand:+ start:8594 stop:9742 length:1149 start_codon:yes stop_codon:yes gene_type:complete